MATSDLITYYQEVFNFLSSLSIKFTPLADAVNEQVLNAGGSVDAASPESWKYYLNLTGQYHPIDTAMMVLSLDTQQSILFSPQTLTLHPKTAAAYVPGNPLYAALCAQYPNQVDLIKSIVYPVLTLETAISAPDFCILAYGSAILEADEYDTILQTIRSFLSYIQRRWYFSFFSYEPYYTWVFWGNLWQQLISIILTARILAIKTTQVHSWHIKQYLKSYGLDDYSDVLSRTQMLFLYRNLPYIIANRGKQSNLIILADYLLSGLGFGLYGRDIWQQTLDGAATCRLTPYLVPIAIPTTYVNALPAESAETVSQIEERLYAMGTEVDVDQTALAAMTTRLGTTHLNTLPTKLLELRPVATDLKFARVLNNFLLDSLVYAAIEGLYTTTVTVVEPITRTTLVLSVIDALILYSYCVFRSLLTTPTQLPTQYTIKTAFLRQPTLPTTLAFNGVIYPITDFTNVSNYLSTYAWPSTPATSPAEFSAILSTQFLAAINQIQISRFEEDTLTNLALRRLTESVTVRETLALPLPAGMTTYAEWMAAQTEPISTMIAALDAQPTPTASYTALSDLILSTLLPPTKTFELYGNFAFTGTTYSKFKQLFVQLCSYNVLFMDADPTVEAGVFLGKLSSYTKTRTFTQTRIFPLASPLKITHHVSDVIRVTPTTLTLSLYPIYDTKHSSPDTRQTHVHRQVGGEYRMASGTGFRDALCVTPAPLRFNLHATNRNHLQAIS